MGQDTQRGADLTYRTNSAPATARRGPPCALPFRAFWVTTAYSHKFPRVSAICVYTYRVVDFRRNNQWARSSEERPSSRLLSCGVRYARLPPRGRIASSRLAGDAGIRLINVGVDSGARRDGCRDEKLGEISSDEGRQTGMECA